MTIIDPQFSYEDGFQDGYEDGFQDGLAEATALDRVGGLTDEGLIIAALRGDPAFTHEAIARIWPRLMTAIRSAIE